MYFNVFFKLIKVRLLVSELYTYQNCCLALCGIGSVQAYTVACGIILRGFRSIVSNIHPVNMMTRHEQLLSYR